MLVGSLYGLTGGTSSKFNSYTDIGLGGILVLVVSHGVECIPVTSLR